MATLLSSATANGAGTGASHSAGATVFVTGVFDGATVTVEVSADDTTYVKADNVSVVTPSRLVAPGVCRVDCTGDYYIRCVVSGVGSATDIDAEST